MTVCWRPKYYVQVLFVLDLCTSEILLAKPFFPKLSKAWNGKIVNYKPVKPSLIAKEIGKQVPPFPLIIHSDRGPEFVSPQWYVLFQNERLIGSMTPPEKSHPTRSINQSSGT